MVTWALAFAGAESETCGAAAKSTVGLALETTEVEILAVAVETAVAAADAEVKVLAAGIFLVDLPSRPEVAAAALLLRPGVERVLFPSRCKKKLVFLLGGGVLQNNVFYLIH